MFFLARPRRHFPMQKSRKMTSKSSSIRTVPVMRPSARRASRRSSAASAISGAASARPSELATFVQRFAMARAGERRCLRRRPPSASRTERRAVSSIGQAGPRDRRTAARTALAVQVDLVDDDSTSMAESERLRRPGQASDLALPVLAASSTRSRRSADVARAWRGAGPPADGIGEGRGRWYRPASTG